MKLNDDWAFALKEVLDSPEYEGISKKVNDLYKMKRVFPAQVNIFSALNACPYKELKVCIIGQDPYHGPDQANGMAFSVSKGVKIPPSLRNIYKELESDLGISQAEHGDLSKWAQQGVLLLNTVLTVEAGKANSHRNMGWEFITDEIIRVINQDKEGLIFVLWGKPAQRFKMIIDSSKHTIIESSHPSPLSAYRGFLGSKPFSQINHLLVERGEHPIEWQIE